MEKRTAGFKDAPLVQEYPDLENLSAHEVTENKVAFAQGELHSIYFKDVYLSHYIGNVAHEVTYGISGNRQCVQLCFSFDSDSFYRSETLAKPIAHFNKQQYNLLYFAGEKISKTLQPCEPTEIVEIAMTPAFFMRFIPATSSPCNTFLEKILKQTSAKMNKHNLPITPRIASILHEIVHGQQKGFYKRLLVEAKIIELLALQFEQCEQCGGKASLPVLKRSDIEKMQHAREILISNLQTPYSLVELSHKVGTNEYYLKKYFKQVFGNTVFGYLHTYRMEQAKKALLESEKKVSDIAFELGYKYPSHFTTAFKKYFGYLPQKVKSQNTF